MSRDSWPVVGSVQDTAHQLTIRCQEGGGGATVWPDGTYSQTYSKSVEDTLLKQRYRKKSTEVLLHGSNERHISAETYFYGVLLLNIGFTGFLKDSVGFLHIRKTELSHWQSQQHKTNRRLKSRLTSSLTTFIQVEVILIAELFGATSKEYIILPKEVLKAGDLWKTTLVGSARSLLERLAQRPHHRMDAGLNAGAFYGQFHVLNFNNASWPRIISERENLRFPGKEKLKKVFLINKNHILFVFLCNFFKWLLHHSSMNII